MQPRDHNAGDRSPWRGVRQHAAELGIGARTVYRAIQRGELRGAPVNDRGDLLIHDDWIQEWLEQRAAKAPTLRKVVG